MTDLSQKHCVPCEGGDPPLTEEEEDGLIKKVNGWFLLRDGEHKIRKVFKLKSFKEAMRLVNSIATIAEKEGHHPDIYIFYNKVQIELFTHAVGGLSENDFIMASKIDLI
ncbi:MAG: pterin-4-alpha-carbinolamine dehydratase [Microgenomates group bacterium GW2011_GWC1_38_14]|nr:MAG: pterin-4-alpha-carbinolamine dehydratase [Candidatus Levybacteria bacterium GW2011_GWB1_36_18]KKQ57178.1 MAG: pterin-4-alpha-carbinolamine dehydratase [Microgenomates group bacterium GW2011_GWC1_38_14]